MDNRIFAAPLVCQKLGLINNTSESAKVISTTIDSQKRFQRFLLPPERCINSCAYDNILKTDDRLTILNFIFEHLPQGKVITETSVHRTSDSDFLIFQLGRHVALVVFAGKNGIESVKIETMFANGNYMTEQIFSHNDVKASYTSMASGKILEFARISQNLDQIDFKCSGNTSLTLYLQPNALRSINIIKDGKCNIVELV